MTSVPQRTRVTSIFVANGLSHQGGKRRLVIFPGEGTNGRGTTVGHIYVVGSPVIKKYEAVGGPPPGRGFQDLGGHTAGVTPPGHYVLDRQEHHIIESWPQSVVPWGAAIRDNNGVIEYQVGGTWKAASGTFGSVTHAIMRYAHKGTKTLITPWNKNDFGKWSWNLKQNGHRTPYFIHTTPDDEAATTAGKGFELVQSHGCIHIRPRDRDEMMTNGVLKEGVEVEVRRYGQVGPPR